MKLCRQCGASLAQNTSYCAHCGSRVSDQSTDREDPFIGRSIDGSYVLQELIGLGGMGRVYRAEQSALGRSVAVKLIHPHLLGDEQSVARFYTEARATSRLNHPNSVSVIDFGRTEDGALYLVMEFLNGKDLGFVIEQEGPLPLQRAVDIADGVLAALDEAHEQGVVHRDLKPENIIIKRLRRGGELVKVVDFGLATMMGPSSTSITQPGMVCGTPDYMSPEQGRGEPVDGRGDLYAVGVVLFELIVDRLPYCDDSPARLVMKHINDPIPDPRKVAPHRGIPSVLAELVIRAMAKDPEERFQDAQAMKEALSLAAQQLRPDQTAGARIVCALCGCTSATGSRFCRECGTALGAGDSVTPPSLPPGHSLFPRAQPASPLIGRTLELKLFAQTCQQAESLRRIQVAGPAGIGKTRLLHEMAIQADQRGELVVSVRPHPSGAPVPYYAMRRLIMGITGVDQFIEVQAAAISPLANAGFREVAEPSGFGHSRYGSKAGAVLELLKELLEQRIEASSHRRVILIVDDAHLIDGLSKQVLLEMPHQLSHLPCVVIEALEDPKGANLHSDATRLRLEALDLEEVACLHPEAFTNSDALPKTAISPLFLEQLLALKLPLSHLSGSMRLADAIMQRTERLDARARRLLQALSVLGTSCEKETLASFCPEYDEATLADLQREQFVAVEEQTVELTYPIVRDLVETAIPLEYRRSLHQRALSLATSAASIEVRAEHAWRSGDTTTALMLLDRVSRLALDRGDAETAVLSGRRGLQVARRHLLEHGDEALDAAIVNFSLRLAQAMACAGDPLGADGVLQEALDLTPMSSLERVKLQVTAGEIALKRQRRRRAIRYFESALTSPHVKERPELSLQAHLGLARVAVGEGEAEEALEHFDEALSLSSRLASASLRQAEVTLERAEYLADSGQHERALESFAEAQELAESAGHGALAAAAAGGQGTIEELQGSVARAHALYVTALNHSAAAGDAPAYRRWTQAVSATTGAARS